METMDDIMKLSESDLTTLRESFDGACRELGIRLNEGDAEELFLDYLAEGLGQGAKKWLAGAALSLCLLGGAHASSIPGLEKFDDGTAQDVYDTAVEYVLKGADVQPLKAWIDGQGGNGSVLLKKAYSDVGSSAGKYKTTKGGKDFKVVDGKILVQGGNALVAYHPAPAPSTD